MRAESWKRTRRAEVEVRVREIERKGEGEVDVDLLRERLMFSFPRRWFFDGMRLVETLRAFGLRLALLVTREGDGARAERIEGKRDAARRGDCARCTGGRGDRFLGVVGERERDRDRDRERASTFRDAMLLRGCVRSR